MRTRLIQAAALFAVGCYSPDLSNVVFQCSDEKPGCPAGHSCVSGRCLPQLSDGGSAEDGGNGPSDGATDLPAVSGCRDGRGSSVGPKAFACPGVFLKGQAASRCATGWSLCTDGSKVDSSACNQLGGFFVAEALGAWIDSVDTAECSMARTGTNAAFFGCGAIRGRYTFTAVTPCKSLPRVLDCTSTNSLWECLVADHRLAMTSNPIASDGVLRCGP